MALSIRVRWMLLGLVVGQSAILLAPDIAKAQADRAKRAKGLGTEVEEITVTAQRREENIQETPVSVTAVTTDTIAEQSIDNVIDVAPLTPNLYVRTNVGGNTGQTMSMRGAVSTDQMITMETAVGVYVDGAYVSKAAGSRFDLRDVERIEVLRGPQGTLYGRNTVGGAINIITKKPQGDRSVSALTSANEYSGVKSALTVDLPLAGENGLVETDALGKVNTRSTIQYRYRDGFYRNTGSGSPEFDNANRIETNQAVRWMPVEALTVDYSFDYTRVRERPNAFQLSGLRPGTIAYPLVSGQIGKYKQVHRSDSVANNPLIKPYGGTQDLVTKMDVRGHALSQALSLGEVGPLGDVTLKSITGYRSFNSLENQDLDGAPVSVGDYSVLTTYRSFTQELQWLGSLPRVNYVAGFFYDWERGCENSDQVILGGTPFISAFQSKNWITSYSYAPFGQATWTPPVLDDRLSFTAGIRYSQDNKHQGRRYDCVKSGGQPCSARSFSVSGAQANRDFDEVTPMGNVAFQWTDDLMTYFKVSRGYKSGGFNGRATTASLFLDPYSSETLTAYELGAKSEWLDKRLRVNLSGFYSDYKNLQVGVFRADPAAGGVTTVENAADAEIMGLELEVQAVPVRGIDVRLAYGWLDPEYKEFWEDNPKSGLKEDVAGKRFFSVTPDHTISSGITYTAEPTQSGTFSIGLDMYWQDAVVFAVKDVDLNAQGSYALLNARAQLADIPTAYGSFDVAGFARNLTDRAYRVYGIDFGDLGYAGNFYGNPRTVGVEVAWRWKAS